MAASAVNPETGASTVETKPVFHVFLAYEGVALGKLAMRLCAALMHDCGVAFEAHYSLWRLNLLSLPSLRQMAEGDAREADMVFLSLQDDPQLTGELRGLHEVLQQTKRASRGAMVVLLALPEGQGAARSETCLLLEQVAQAANLDLFLEAKPLRLPEFDLAAEKLTFRAAALSSVLEDTLHYAPAPRWGINE